MHASGGWRLVALGLLGAAAVVVLFAGLTRSEQRAIERAAWRELVGVWEAGKEEYVAYFVEHSYHAELKRHYGNSLRGRVKSSSARASSERFASTCARMRSKDPTPGRT